LDPGGLGCKPAGTGFKKLGVKESVMGYEEEPAYRQFEGACRECGKTFIYYNSVKRHPEHEVCRDCELKEEPEVVR